MGGIILECLIIVMRNCVETFVQTFARSYKLCHYFRSLGKVYNRKTGIRYADCLKSQHNFELTLK